VHFLLANLINLFLLPSPKRKRRQIIVDLLILLPHVLTKKLHEKIIKTGFMYGENIVMDKIEFMVDITIDKQIL